MENELMPLVIDIDLIQSMRRSGKKQAANELLECYYADLKKVKKNALSDYWKNVRRVKKYKGICISNSCEFDAKENNQYCQKHYNNYKEYKKNERLCLKAKKEAIKNGQR